MGDGSKVNGNGSEANGAEAKGSSETWDLKRSDATANVQPNARKFSAPRPPTYGSKEEELQAKLKLLAAAYRIFAERGFDDGNVAGHITMRDPMGRGFWVNEFGADFEGMTVDQLLLVGHDGKVIEGGRNHQIYNMAGFCIHHALHEARPDVEAACHAHSPSAKAFSSFAGRKFEMLTQDSCIFYKSLGVHENFGGVVLDDEEGRQIAKSLGQNKAVLLANHGPITVGGSVEDAVAKFVALESACDVQLRVDAASAGCGLKPTIIHDEEAAFTEAATGTAAAGWFMAQPLFQRDARKQKQLGLA